MEHFYGNFRSGWQEVDVVGLFASMQVLETKRKLKRRALQGGGAGARHPRELVHGKAGRAALDGTEVRWRGCNGIMPCPATSSPLMVGRGELSLHWWAQQHKWSWSANRLC